MPEAEVNLGILNVCYGGTQNLDFIADSIDRRQICGMLRAIVNNIKGGDLVSTEILEKGVVTHGGTET